MSQDNPAISSKRTVRMSREALLQKAVEEPDLSWRVLITLNIFRMLVAAALLGLFFSSGEPRIFGDAYPRLFATTATIYLICALIFSTALRQRWARVGPQAVTQNLVDIIAVVLLIHTSGGISSGLGGLLIVFVGAGSLVMPRQYPAILGALATFAILGEQVLTQIAYPAAQANYPAAGLLSAIIFTTSLAARPLARRIQESEALARQRGVDLQNLSELNEYIVQHLRESIIVVDEFDRVRLSNGSAARLLGVERLDRSSPLSDASEPLFDYLGRWRKDAALSSHPEFTLITEGTEPEIEGLEHERAHHGAPGATRQGWRSQRTRTHLSRGREYLQCARAAIETGLTRSAECQHRARDPQSRRRHESCGATARRDGRPD